MPQQSTGQCHGGTYQTHLYVERRLPPHPIHQQVQRNAQFEVLRPLLCMQNNSNPRSANLLHLLPHNIIAQNELFTHLRTLLFLLVPGYPSAQPSLGHDPDVTLTISVPSP